MDDTPEVNVPQPPAERVFPPWSSEALFAWAIAYAALSYPVGYVLGKVFTQSANALQLQIDAQTVLLFGGLACALVYEVFALLFIHFSLKRACLPLREPWGSFSATPFQLFVAALLGSVIMLASLTLSSGAGDPTGNPPSAPIGSGWLPLFLVLSAYIPGAAVEELFFRGLLHRSIRRRASIHSATMISSLLFVATHIRHLSDPLRSITDFLLGASAALLYERNRSLTPCVILHFAANATTVAVHYLPHGIPV